MLAVTQLVGFGASPLTPLSIADCGLWLDAADSNTITISTGVSQWNDKSGNGYNCTQGTGANQPTYNSADKNGLNTLTFDGSNDRLDSTSFSMPSILTEFVVLQSSVTSGTGRTFVIGSGGGFTTNEIGLRAISNSGSACFWGERLPTNQPITMPSTDLSSWVRGTYVRDTTTSQKARFGTASYSTNTNSTTSFTATAYCLGALGSGSNFWSGKIGEVIAYSRSLSDGEISVIEQYLSQKWGV